MDRKYVEKQAKTNKLLATDLGITVTEQLKQFFKDIMDLYYTAGVEEKLDNIAEGEQQWVNVIRDFYGGFTKDLDNASKNMKKPEPEVVKDEKCPVCGGEMLLRRSKYGEYLGCANYPKCKGKKNLNAAAEPPQETNEVCEKCGKPMVIRNGRRGRFMACSGYPDCKNTYSVDAQGNKVASTGPLDSGRKCEKCGKPLVLRHSAKGSFLGCGGYPKCKNIVNVTPDEIAEIKKLNEGK
jgi:DNA topoisomerase-1